MSWWRSMRNPTPWCNAKKKSLPNVTHITLTNYSPEELCVLCRRAGVPPRTPAMDYFTGTAPRGPQCHALMLVPLWMSLWWWRPLSQQALKHPAVERRAGIECHCSSRGHQSLPGPSCCPDDGVVKITRISCRYLRQHIASEIMCLNVHLWVSKMLMSEFCYFQTEQG